MVPGPFRAIPGFSRFAPDADIRRLSVRDMTESIIGIRNSVYLEIREHWWGFSAIIMTTVLFVMEPYILNTVDLGRFRAVGQVPGLFSSGVVVALIVVFMATYYLLSLNPCRRDRIPFMMFIATPFVTFLSRLGTHPTFLAGCLVMSVIFLRAAHYGRIDVVRTPLYLVLPLMPLSIVISTLGPFSKGLYSSVGTYATSFILPLVLIINLVRSEEELERTLKVFFLLIFLSVIAGIIQFGIYETTGTLTTFAQEDFQFRSTPVGVLPRITALMTHPNIFGAVSAIMGIMMSYYYIHPEYVTEKERRRCLYGSIFCYMGVVLSVSRGATMGVGLASFLVLLYKRNRYLLHFVMALVFFLGIAYATGLLEKAYEMYKEMAAAEGSMRFREQLIGIAFEGIRNYPIHGIGIDGFNNYNNPIDHIVHNYWLYILSELGIIGFLAHLFFLLFMSFRLIKKILKNEGRNRMILESFLLGMVVFFFLSNFEPLLSNKFYWFYFGLMEAAILTVGKEGRKYRFLPLISLDEGAVK